MSRQHQRRERRMIRGRAGPDPLTASHARLSISEEAARIMAEQGVRDFQVAKEKAALRLGISRRNTALPTNLEVEGALVRRLHLFNARGVIARQQRLLSAAATTMERLSEYQPRLVGALIRGNVTERTPVELHVFAETSEAVLAALVDTDTRVDQLEKRVRFARKRYMQIPAFNFDLDDASIEVLVFKTKEIREAPLCPVEGRPMVRARLKQVRDMLKIVPS